ncbi:hypothetical protein LXL04_029038 [Taraxacum kok-saghyz]
MHDFIHSRRGAMNRFIIKQIPSGVTHEAANGESVQMDETVIKYNTKNVDNAQQEEEQEDMPCEDENIANLNGNGENNEDIQVNIYDPIN